MTFAYDAANQLVSSTATGKTAAYQYDGREMEEKWCHSQRFCKLKKIR